MEHDKYILMCYLNMVCDYLYLDIFHYLDKDNWFYYQHFSNLWCIIAN